MYLYLLLSYAHKSFFHNMKLNSITTTNRKSTSFLTLNATIYIYSYNKNRNQIFWFLKKYFFFHRYNFPVWKKYILMKQDVMQSWKVSLYSNVSFYFTYWRILSSFVALLNNISEWSIFFIELYFLFNVFILVLLPLGI